MGVLDKAKRAFGKATSGLSKRKIPREQVPFYCIVGFFAAVAASVVLSTVLTLVCDWATGGAFSWR